MRSRFDYRTKFLNFIFLLMLILGSPRHVWADSSSSEDLCQAVLKGKREAIQTLGKRISNIRYKSSTAEMDLKCLEDAAANGRWEASHTLSEYYICRDPSKALDYIRPAAEAADPQAMRTLARYLLNLSCGGNPEDPGQAVEWLRKAAGKGDSQAMDMLGDCYQKGQGLPIDLEQARLWYKKAAAMGMAQAEDKAKKLEICVMVSRTFVIEVPKVTPSQASLTISATIQMLQDAPKPFQIQIADSHAGLAGEAQQLRPISPSIEQFKLDHPMPEGFLRQMEAYNIVTAVRNYMVGRWVLSADDGTVLDPDFRPKLEKMLIEKCGDTGFQNIQIAQGRFSKGGPKTLVLWISAPAGAFLVRLNADGSLGAVRRAADQFACGQLSSFYIKDLGYDAVGFVSEQAGSAYYYHWIFWDWTNDPPKTIFDAYTDPGMPTFQDLENDGNQEMVFLNPRFDHPQIFQWEEKNGRFEPAESKHPAFWNQRIQAGYAKLRAWHFPVPYEALKDRLPLTVVEVLLGDFKRRGGKQGVDEFLALTEASLRPLIKNGSNDYVQGRAQQLLKRVQKELGP